VTVIDRDQGDFIQILTEVMMGIEKMR